MITDCNSILPIQTQNIPQELKDRPQWVVWKLESRHGKPAKVPYTPLTRRKASTTDLQTWGTFEEAVEALDGYDGVGFVFCSADPYTGIDLDHCRNPESGEIDHWAMRIVQDLSGGYAEVSPSGTGVHVIVKGKAPKNGRHDDVEMYSSERFFTITGHSLEGGDD